MKSSSVQTIIFALLFSLLSTCVYTGPATAALKQYVTKYREIQVSKEQRRRLNRYDYLIKYFCSFSFFKPRHKVNPDFIRALILAESNANPRAKSQKSAKGLTQIIYKTGKQAARDLLKKKHSLSLCRHKETSEPQARGSI